VQKVATKKQIKSAVELMFNVEVDAVQVLNVKGKVKRFGRALGKTIRLEKSLCQIERRS
jgi:large subunit ribosomal protein L23